MDEQQKKYLTIGFILLNFVLWGIFIIPKVGPFIVLIRSSVIPTSDFIPGAQSSKNILERIDFYTLRNPFKTAVSKTSQQPQRQEIQYQRNKSTKTEYISQFKLKSIVQLKDNFVAALEYSPTSQQQANDQPYSYRFSPQGEAQNQNTSYTVMVGDEVMGEKIIKINGEEVILEKEGAYYLINFTGGYPVDKPQKN